MKVCQECGFKNNDDTKFCVNCGNNIQNCVSIPVKICQQCGHQNNENTSFCVNCGNKLPDLTPPQTQEPEEDNLKDETPEAIDEPEAIAEEDVSEEIEESEDSVEDETPDEPEETSDDDGVESVDEVEESSEDETPEETVDDKTSESTDEPDVVNQESSVKTCNSCGHENDPATTFCVNCGSKIEDEPQVDAEEDAGEEVDAQESSVKTCKACGHENAPETAFCVNCGNDLDNETPIQPETTYLPNEKFFKKEKKVVKKISKQLCPIEDLYSLAGTKEEYEKTAKYFSEWVSQYVVKEIPKIWYFGLYEHWRSFKTNCISGLISCLVVEDYELCLTNCNKLLDIEETVYKKGIGSHTANGLIAGAKTLAALTGKTGTDEQKLFYQKVKVIKAAALYELGKQQEAHDLLIQLPGDYGIKINSRDPYLNQHFKYKDKLYVSILLNEIN